MKNLTPRQDQILAFIKQSITDNGMPPTRAEIAEHCGFASWNAAQCHLEAMQKKGYIVLGSGKSRSIKVVA